MENLYKEDWCQKLQWERQKSFLTWPEEAAETLYNSDALCSAGRSPAVDFGKERARKLSGYRNYYKLWVRTDGPKATVDKKGLTTFWVMRQTKVDKEMPAEAVIKKDIGEAVAHLINSS